MAPIALLVDGLNPYFIGLPILIKEILKEAKKISNVSILILLDYLFLLSTKNLNQI